MKNTLIIPYISRDRLIAKLAFLPYNAKIVGYSITYEDVDSCNNTKFGSTRMLPTNPDKYRLVKPEEIDIKVRANAEGRRHSETTFGDEDLPIVNRDEPI